MARKMALVGADLVLIATPCFYKSGMTNEALEIHYTKVHINLNNIYGNKLLFHTLRYLPLKISPSPMYLLNVLI